MLSARFHAIRDRTLARVDRTFAEPVRLSPMKGKAADPSRQQIVIEAVLRVGEGKNTKYQQSQDAVWRSRLIAGKAELHIDRAKYPDLNCQEGDKVRALARPGEPLFEVLAIDARGHTRLVLQLSEA